MAVHDHSDSADRRMVESSNSADGSDSKYSSDGILLVSIINF